jgi:hypothetical protein
VIGKHCLVTHVYNKTVSVTGYDPKLGSMKGMRIISAALAYVDPLSGETLILRVHKAVQIPTMPSNLLCPMQMRLNDIDWTFGDVLLAEDFGVDVTAEDVQELYSNNSQDDNGVPDRDDLPDNHYDQYVNAEVLLPKGDSMVTGKVKRRKLDDLGIPTGR